MTKKKKLPVSLFCQRCQAQPRKDSPRPFWSLDHMGRMICPACEKLYRAFIYGESKEYLQP